MPKSMPIQTIQAVARSVYKETSNYGFGPVDTIRLINELMDLCSAASERGPAARNDSQRDLTAARSEAPELPIKSQRIIIRRFDAEQDLNLLRGWLPDKYGRFFVLSCATAQTIDIEMLVNSPLNVLGTITLLDGTPIGAMAYLDFNKDQKRAELRKLIGVPEARGKGYAEEATRLWIDYGISALGLQKIYVSTLQTHIGNIRLNEDVGFKVEGLLQNEVCIDGERYDLLRMGLCSEDLLSDTT